jgi:hypothetical protein
MSAKVGDWAEYTTTMKEPPGQAPMVMRYALVEKSAKKMALEIDGKTPMGPLVMRMEFQPGSEPNTWKVSAARMSMGGQPPTEMPVPENTPPLRKGGDEGDLVGKGSVKTAVGTFDCKQFKKSLDMKSAGVASTMTIHLWMSDKVPPVGLVKQETGDGKLSSILTATGSGATAKLSQPGKPAPQAKPAPAPAKK